MSAERSEPSAAEVQFDQAAEALRRESVVQDLAAKSGLSYGRITDSVRGPYLVAWDGQIIGEVRSDTDSAINDWYAVSVQGDQRSDPAGPFHTIRAAAASLPR